MTYLTVTKKKKHILEVLEVTLENDYLFLLLPEFLFNKSS